jgi:hypothetical protein
MSESVVENDIINVENKEEKKKSRGRPPLSPEEKELKKEAIKEYQKQYREENKEKLASYESKKYNNKTLETTKKNYKKYSDIINIIKFLYFNNLICIKDDTKEKELKILLNNCKR